MFLLVLQYSKEALLSGQASPIENSIVFLKDSLAFHGDASEKSAYSNWKTTVHAAATTTVRVGTGETPVTENYCKREIKR